METCKALSLPRIIWHPCGKYLNSGRILRARLEAGNCHPGTLFRTDIDVHLLGLREAQEKRGSSMNWTQNDQIKEIQKFAGTLT